MRPRSTAVAIVATLFVLLPLAVVVAAAAEETAAPQPRLTHRGHLPKSRSELKREQERRDKKRREAIRLEAQAELLKQEEAERVKKWKQEREQMRQNFVAAQQRKQKALEKAEAKVKAEAEAAAKKKAAQALKLQQQLEREQAEQDRLDPAKQGGIVGGQVDCFGVPGGTAVRDACGVCGGDDSSCIDCAGIPHGNSTEDCAGVCQGDDRSCVDCAGVMNGGAVVDQCDVCDGDGTSCLDCLGVVKGTAQLDVCGICDGDGSSCADCRGVANGPARVGPCGICQGDGSSCCSPMHPKDALPRSAITQDPDGTVRIDREVIERVQSTARGPSPYSSSVLCTDHGTCSYERHFCVCDRGWTGPYCSVPQNLCLHHQGQESGDQADPCNGRGECQPQTGMCLCSDPEQWVGPRCEFSRCNRRGAYDLAAGRCKCRHGYGGRFCERCVSAKPRSGQVHVCMEIMGAWQPVPRDLWLERSILLGDKNPRAPVFELLDAKESKAQAYVYGISFMNAVTSPHGHTKHRDFIWPNSTHPRSGYYYDCGCRLQAPPVGSEAGVVQQSLRDTGAANRTDSLVRLYRPQFPNRPGFSRYMAKQSQMERQLTQRAPATLPECQALVQEVLDEFGFTIDAATAESSELSSAIGEVSSTCGSEATFSTTWFLLALLVFVVVLLLTVLFFWCMKRYVRIQNPMEEL